MNQFEKHIEAFKKKEESRIREIDAFNHNLGLYMVHAYHNPKKYPKQPFTAKAELMKPKEPMSLEEMEKIMKRFTIRSQKNTSNGAK